MATYSDYQDLKQRKPLRWWHEALIDYMLTHPGAPLKELANEFKRSISHISIIINTDMFKAKFAQRRAAFNEELGHSVQRKLLTSLDLALDVVHEQMTTKRTQIPFRDTTAFVNSTLERLGYGMKAPGVSVTVNTNGSQHVALTQADLQEARALLRRSEAAKVIDSPTPTIPLLEADLVVDKKLPDPEGNDAA